ncbi:MAG: uroporphyrinogen-III synthase [Candidatus Eisenbacteria bacterium]
MAAEAGGGRARSANGNGAAGGGGRSRREEILEAAAGLFAGRELSQVRMEELAERAGVAKGTLYLYFPSKENLYLSILDSRMDHLMEGLRAAFEGEESSKLRLRKILVHVLLFLLRYPNFFRMMRKEEACPIGSAVEGGAAPRWDRLRSLLREELQRGLAEGSVRAMPVEMATDLVLGALEGAALRCLAEGKAAQRGNAEPEQLFDFVWRGLGAGGAAAGSGIAGTLRGARILVTREEGDGLAAAIERRGGVALHLPLLVTQPPRDRRPLEEAAARAASYDWVLFTSARGVDAFADATEGGAAPAGAGRPLSGNRPAIGAVGEATAARARDRFGRCDLVAATATGGALAGALLARVDRPAGLRALLPRAEQAQPELPARLRAAGVEVTEVVAYRTELSGGVAFEAIEADLLAGRIDAICLTSPSGARAFEALLGRAWREAPAPRPRVVAIGPTTAAAMRSLGMAPDAEAREASNEGMAEAVERALLGHAQPASGREATGEAIGDGGGGSGAAPAGAGRPITRDRIEGGLR